MGFPGETEAHFEHLLNFTERHQFDHVGVFSFSPEEGTPAYSLDAQVPLEIRGATARAAHAGSATPFLAAQPGRNR